MSEELEYETEFDDLPVSQAVKVIRKSNDLGSVPGLPDEELADPYEMERMAYLQERETILTLPTARRGVKRVERYTEENFNADDLERDDEVKRVPDGLAEQARDIAISHSCAKDDEGRERAKRRFRYLVDTKLRSKALRLAGRIRRDGDDERRGQMLGQLDELNQRIRKMNGVWKEHSCWE